MRVYLQNLYNVRWTSSLAPFWLFRSFSHFQTVQNCFYILRQQIIDHSRGKLTKDNPLPVTEAKVETSAFSEEDFANFEKDYVARRKIDNLLLDFQS